MLPLILLALPASAGSTSENLGLGYSAPDLPALRGHLAAMRESCDAGEAVLDAYFGAEARYPELLDLVIWYPKDGEPVACLVEEGLRYTPGRPSAGVSFGERQLYAVVFREEPDPVKVQLEGLFLERGEGSFSASFLGGISLPSSGQARESRLAPQESTLNLRPLDAEGEPPLYVGVAAFALEVDSINRVGIKPGGDGDRAYFKLANLSDRSWSPALGLGLPVAQVSGGELGGPLPKEAGIYVLFQLYPYRLWGRHRALDTAAAPLQLRYSSALVAGVKASPELLTDPLSQIVAGARLPIPGELPWAHLGVCALAGYEYPIDQEASWTPTAWTSDTDGEAPPDVEDYPSGVEYTYSPASSRPQSLYLILGLDYAF